MWNAVVTLAARMRAMPPEQLAASLRRRQFSPGRAALDSIADHFDLAEALLRPDSLQAVLRALDRETLAVLAALSRHENGTSEDDIVRSIRALPLTADAAARSLATASELLLTDTADSDREPVRHRVLDAVAEQLATWPALGLPSLDDLIDTPPPHPEGHAEGSPGNLAGDRADGTATVGGDVSVDRVAAEHAFDAVSTVTELLVELERHPARARVQGGVTSAEVKRLAEAAGVHAAVAEALLPLIRDGGYAVERGRTWTVTERVEEWHDSGLAARWGRLAAAWLNGLPFEVRDILGEHTVWGETLRALVDWKYPGTRDTIREQIDDAARRAELMGIAAPRSDDTGARVTSRPGALLLRGHAREAEHTMRDLLPREIDSVYIQHDLSVVAPGPLRADLDTRMRRLADVEHRGLATTYRISAASVHRALSTGETAESLTEFLRGVSATGIPQPLEYLLGDASARFGLVRVSTVDGTGLDPDDPAAGMLSAVRSDDPDLLQAIEVDQSLASLELRPGGRHRLVSRQPRDTLYWALLDARYPVAVEGRDRNIVPHRRPRTPAARAANAAPDPLEMLVQRLSDHATRSPHGPERAWMAKLIDSAVRTRTALRAAVELPDGSVTDLELEPTGNAGGRVRGIDRRSDTERTLPLSSIRSVEAID